MASDWLANLAAQPSFTFHLKHGVVADLPATATVIVDPVERRRVLAEFVAQHFEDKDALLGAIADRMWDETQAALDAIPPAGGTDPTSVGIRQVLEALLMVMRRHEPAVAGLVPTRVVECASGLSVTERTLGLLAERGFDPPRAAILARYVLCSAVMLVECQPGVAVVEPAERAEVQRRKKIALASLSPERYPNTVAAANFLTGCDSPEAYFGEGVELVIAGVRNQVPDHKPARARRSS